MLTGILRGVCAFGAEGPLEVEHSGTGDIFVLQRGLVVLKGLQIQSLPGWTTLSDGKLD